MTIDELPEDLRRVALAICGDATIDDVCCQLDMSRPVVIRRVGTAEGMLGYRLPRRRHGHSRTQGQGARQLLAGKVASVAELPELQRRVAELIVRGLTHREVSIELGISTGTVSHRARIAVLMLGAPLPKQPRDRRPPGYWSGKRAGDLDSHDEDAAVRLPPADELCPCGLRLPCEAPHPTIEDYVRRGIGWQW